MRFGEGEEAILAGIHIVVKNMNKMGLISRIGHSHVLRRWSIYLANTTRAVPKGRQIHFRSHLRQKKLILFFSSSVQLF